MKRYILSGILLIFCAFAVLASGPEIHGATKIDSLITSMRGVVKSDANSKGYYAIGGVYSYGKKDTIYVQDKAYFAQWDKKSVKESPIIVALVDSNGTIQWHRKVSLNAWTVDMSLIDLQISESNKMALSIDVETWMNSYEMYVGNETISYSHGSRRWRGMIVSLDAKGGVLWHFTPRVRSSSSSSKSNNYFLEYDFDDNVYFIGESTDSVWLGDIALTYDNMSHFSSVHFIAKISASGKPLWGEMLTTNANSTVRTYDIVSSGSSVYALGLTNGFYRGANFYSALTKGSSSAALVMRFDTAGNYKWYKVIGQMKGASDYEMVKGVTDLKTEDLAFTFFNSDTAYQNLARTQYYQPVKFGMALCILDSSAQVKSFDVLSMGLSNDLSRISALSFTNIGNILVSGSMNGTFIIGKQNFRSNGGYDAFVAGTDSAGQFAWATTTGSPTDDDSILTMYQNPNGDLKLLSMFRTETVLGKDTFTNEGKQEYAITSVAPYRFPPQLQGRATHYVYADSVFNYKLPRFSDYSPKITLSGHPAGLSYDATTKRIAWATERSDLGTHKFKIYIKDRAGIDSMNFTVHVIDQLKASLSVPTQICLGATIEPTVDAPDAGKLSYTWLFGDKAFSYTAKTTYQYQDTGSYQLQVLLENQLGAKDTLSQLLEVSPVPTAAFTATHLCAFDSLQLTDTSHINGASIAQRRWRIDGVELNTTADQLKQYVEVASYEIQLHLTNLHGCQDSTSQTINVNTGLSVKAHLDTQICSSSPVNFTVQPTWFNDQLAKVYWQFEDSLWNKNTQTSQVYLYQRGGSYQPLITVEGTSGCTKTIIGNVEVLQKPTSIFESTKLCVGSPNELLNESEVGDTTIVEHQWLINGLLESNKVDLPVQFSEDGQQKISLISIDANGCSDTLTQNLRVFEQPKVTIKVQDSCAGSETRITANINQQGRDSITSYKWGVNGNSLSELPELNYRFGVESKANVSLVLGTKNGCIAVGSRSIDVAKPESAALSITDACFGDTLSLNEQYDRNNLDSISYSSSAVRIVDFDQPLRAYFTETGKQELRLITHSKQGCKDTFLTEIEIWEQPQASFTYFRKEGQQVYFARADSSAAVYSWTVEGNVISKDHFSYRFASAGTYPVTLSSASDKGCTNEQVREIEIYPLGISNMLEDRVKVLYQSGTVVVSSTDGPIDVALYSMEGKLLLQSLAIGQRHELPTGQFTAGIYLIAITAGNQLTTLKVVLP